jgi:diketogulonate reductase-like aldo/keto reductase
MTPRYRAWVRSTGKLLLKYSSDGVCRWYALKHSASYILMLNIMQGFVPLPKSVTKTRIEENADVFDFELTPEEMKSLDTGEYAPSAWDPTTSKD